MHFDFNEAVFPVEESSTVVIKILLVFQLKYSRELLLLSKCFFSKQKKNQFFQKHLSLLNLTWDK